MKSKILAFLICSILCLSANAQINQRFDNSFTSKSQDPGIGEVKAIYKAEF
jgi:hypothetical protein